MLSLELADVFYGKARALGDETRRDVLARAAPREVDEREARAVERLQERRRPEVHEVLVVLEVRPAPAEEARRDRVDVLRLQHEPAAGLGDARELVFRLERGQVAETL